MRWLALVAVLALVGCSDEASERRKQQRMKYAEQERIEFSLSDGTRCVHLWGKLACGAPPKQ